MEPNPGACHGQQEGEVASTPPHYNPMLEDISLAQIILDRMPCVALLLRPNTREIVVANEPGRAAGASCGTPCYRTWLHRDSPCPWCEAPKAWSTGKPQRREITMGDSVWEAYWIPIADDLYMHYAFDITERRNAEVEQRQSEEQLRHKQKLESLGLMAGGIAHDFNNLFLAILGNTDLALMDLPADSPARPSLVAIQGAAQQAAELSNQMLLFSRRSGANLSTVSLSALVNEMIPLLKVSVSKGVDLVTQSSPDLPSIWADPAQIRQVILNLIINASEAIESDTGEIRIHLSQVDLSRDTLAETYVDDHLAPGPYVSLAVSDTGCGCDEDTRQMLFDPFFTTKTSGRGLGLATVLGIVRGHKGAVDVISRSGQGSTFNVFFPAFVDAPLQTEQSKEEGQGIWTGSGTILMIDDEDLVRTVAEKMLSRLGFEVLLAADGHDALRVMRDRGDRITCILCDLTIPGMSASETLRRIVEIQNGIPVILTSGYGRESIEDPALLKSAAAFIQKPYHIEELRNTLQEILEPISLPTDRPR